MFGRYIAARLLSTAGVWIYNIVAAILAYDVSGSALMVGMVSVAQFGPQLIFAPLSGAMADRGDRRRQLVLGRLLVVFGAGSLAAWIWIAGVDGLPGAWPVIATAFVVGLGFVFTAPAQEALIPALVRPGELAPAVALNSMPPTLARAIGPAVGALVAVSAGPATAFAITAGANLIFVFVILSIDVGTRPIDDGSVDRRIRAGFRYLRQDRGIGLLLGGITAVGIGADPAITLTPPLAESFGGGATQVGVFVSAYGIGSLTVFVVLATLRRRIGLHRLGTTGLLLVSGGLFAAGIVPVLSIVTVSFVVAGAGMTMALTSFTTQLQQRLPDGFRGRIMSLWAVAFLGIRPLAAAVDGAIADATTLPVAFSLVGVVVAVLAWSSRPSAVAQRPVP